MSAQDWLSQEELLQELERAGIALPERTFRFWVANGVLASPVKKPYRGADGRVGYYPRETLNLIPQILQLQEEGWKLRQIRQRLEQPESPSRAGKPSSQAPTEGGQEWATRYLHDLLSDTESRDRRRCFSSPGAAHSELRQVRHYLVARLERWIGRSAAVRATSAFLLSLSQRDFQRLVSRLRIPSSLRLAQALASAEPSGQESISVPSKEQLPGLRKSLGQQRARLEQYREHPRAPVLLERTLASLTQLETALTDSQTIDGERLVQELARLEIIAKQAEADLAFLSEGVS